MTEPAKVAFQLNRNKFLKGASDAEGLRTTLRNAIEQLTRYMEDFTASFGVLVLFDATAPGLRCDLEHRAWGVPLLERSGRTIFVIVVPTQDSIPSASTPGHRPHLLADDAITEAPQAPDAE
jgi:hypothetical protein